MPSVSKFFSNDLFGIASAGSGRSGVSVGDGGGQTATNTPIVCALAAAFSTAAAVPHPATRAVGIAGLAATAYACSSGNSTNGNTSIG